MYSTHTLPHTYYTELPTGEYESLLIIPYAVLYSRVQSLYRLTPNYLERINLMKKSTLIILTIILVLSALLSACKDNPCSNGSGCGLLNDAGSVQQSVTEYLQNSCPKSDGVHCDTMR